MTAGWDVWDWTWAAWLLLFLAAEIPAALSKKPGKTFSEHCRTWFSSSFRRGVLVAFLGALASHLAFHASVLPVIIGGCGIVFFILHRVHPASPDAYDWAKKVQPLPPEWRPEEKRDWAKDAKPLPKDWKP